MTAIGAVAVAYWLIDSYGRVPRHEWTTAALLAAVVFGYEGVTFLLDRRAAKLEERMRREISDLARSDERGGHDA
jgi:hypothetical protein